VAISPDVFKWLMDNAGPIIRYRTSVELLGENKAEGVQSLKKRVLSDDLVKYWLNNLRPGYRMNDLHGSTPEAYENVMGKLYEYGLRKGTRILDMKTEPFCNWLTASTEPSVQFNVFMRTLISAFLAMTGYSENEAVNSVLLSRLEAIYPFAKKGDLRDFHVPIDSFPGFPTVWKKRGRPLINPDLHPNGVRKFPLIYDIYGFLQSTPIMTNPELRSKVEVIIKFIFSPEYQNLPRGYGIMRAENGRYYSCGWSIHLPRYFDPKCLQKKGDYVFGGPTMAQLIMRLNLMSRSKSAREHPWFTRSLAMLEAYRNEDGLVTFPRNFLPDKKVGYWVQASRMGLESNRRRKKAITCESTFRYYEIASRI